MLYFHGSARSKQYQKQSKIKASKDTGFKTHNFKKTCEIIQKMTSKMLKKCEFILVVAPLGPPLAAQPVF